MKTQTRHSLNVSSDLRVVGYNSEDADFDRPRGEIIREVYFIQATNDRGNRRVFGSFDSEALAEAAIEFAPPVHTWDADRPEYGSQAWQLYGEAEQVEAEARQFEAEQFGCDTRFMVF